MLSVPGPLLGGVLLEVEAAALGLAGFREAVQQLAADAAAAQQQLAASLQASEGDLAAALQVGGSGWRRLWSHMLACLCCMSLQQEPAAMQLCP
jgi:hypothetical protein